MVQHDISFTGKKKSNKEKKNNDCLLHFRLELNYCLIFNYYMI